MGIHGTAQQVTGRYAAIGQTVVSPVPIRDQDRHRQWNRKCLAYDPAVSSRNHGSQTELRSRTLESPFGSLSGVGRGAGIDWDLGHSQPLGEESVTQQLETAAKGGRAGAIKKAHGPFGQLVRKTAREVQCKMRAGATDFVHRSCFHTHYRLEHLPSFCRWSLIQAS